MVLKFLLLFLLFVLKVLFLLFLAEKNDLIQFRVVEIGEQSVVGYIGPVKVVAPATKIEFF